jgi:hypothetical protein
MLATVKHFVQHCDSCQRSKAPRQRVSAPLHPLAIPDRHWQSVFLDLVTDLPVTARGYDTIVVFVDRLSKMVHIEAANKSITGESLAELFKVESFSTMGCRILSFRIVMFVLALNFGAGPWKSGA